MEPGRKGGGGGHENSDAPFPREEGIGIFQQNRGAYRTNLLNRKCKIVESAKEIDSIFYFS